MKNRDSDKTKYQKLLLQKYQHQNEFLNLNRCHQQWLHILKIMDWSNLKVLCLNGCQVKANQIKMLAQMQWPNLEKLLIEQNSLTVKGVQNLLLNKWPQLQTLHVAENQMGNEGLSLLLWNFNKLKILNLSDNKFSHVGLSLNPGQSRYSPSLRQIYLSFNSIGAKGVKLLIKASYPNLQNLRIVACDINDEGSKHLSKGRWPNLKSLQMQQNNVTYNGNLHLANYSTKGLEFLNVGNLDEIGNSENDIDMMSLMVLVCVLETSTMICPTNLNLNFLDSQERIIRRKFIRNMYEI